MVGDRLDHVAEIEGALLLGHAGVEDDLQQQIAEFVLQVVEIAARDGVGHLVGFLERVGRDRREVLLEVPGQPLPGVRSAAMISISRAMSREGFTRRWRGDQAVAPHRRIRHIMEYL